MTTPTAQSVLDRSFLETRARLLDIAANLDRMSRAPEAHEVENDPRLSSIRQAFQVLLNEPTRRAEAIQQLFSVEYDPAWPRPTPQV